MTDLDIVGKYNRADDKKATIKILSELNACSEHDIRVVLLRNGISESDLPKEPKKRGRKPKEEVEEQAKVVKENEEFKPRPRVSTEMVERKNRMEAIPAEVKVACQERIATLTNQIKELEKERDTLCDYLGGMVINEQNG